MTPCFVRAIVLVVLLGVGLLPVPPAAAAGRDPLASVVHMEAPRIKTVPSSIFVPEQLDSLNSVINEAREFGVPLVLRAIKVPSSVGLLSQASVIDGAAPTAEQVTARMAEEWLSREAIETSPGAEDGILLLVVIPEDDHRLTTAAFATGPRALPLNGLTRERLDRAVTDVMQPFFENDSVAAGISSGIAHLSYDNLFAAPARLEPTPQQAKLHTVTDTFLAGLAGLSVVAVCALAMRIWRRDETTVVADAPVRSPYEAGALARGRVDESIVAAALLRLMERGAVVACTGRSNALVLGVEPDVPVTDPFERKVLERLALESGGAGKLTGSALRRLQDVVAPAREWLQDDLASRRLFNWDARVETMWMILGCAVAGTIAVFSLGPSIISMSRLGVFAIVTSLLAIAAALTWAARRSWTTRLGKRSLARWLSATRDTSDLVTYDMIVRQDSLLDIPGGPDVPPPVRVVRELRGLGAG